MTRMAECHPEKPVASRGLCPMCYARLRRTGTTEARPQEARPRESSLPMLRDPDAPCCHVCAIDGVKLVRFNLIQTVTVDGRHTTRGAGSITLCARCWRTAQAHARRRSGKCRLRAVA